MEEFGAECQKFNYHITLKDHCGNIADKIPFSQYIWKSIKGARQSIQVPPINRSSNLIVAKMKFITAILSVIIVLATFIPTPSLAQEDFNYLLASYDYSVAIKHNFDEANLYYAEYLSQELGRISDRVTDRLLVALGTQTEDASHGRSISTCADSAAYSIQTLLTPVHTEMLSLNTNGNKLHQAIYPKLMEVNILQNPMDEFYYEFTNDMLTLYIELNEEILPKLTTEIVALVVGGDGIYQTMDNCLNQIN